MSKRKTRAARGAVLIMVLTVMFVLIFLLAGAVAVVYSSNRRVMVQYEESQAYYTARSILDTYKDSLLGDNTTKTSGGKYYYYDITATPPTIKSVDIKQGRSLELDLYSVPVCTDPTRNVWITAGEGNEDLEAKITASPTFNKVNIVDSAVTSTLTNFDNYKKQYTQTTAWDNGYTTDSNGNKIFNMKTLSDVGYENAADADDVIIYEFATDLRAYQSAGSAQVVNKLADEDKTTHLAKCKIIVEVLERNYVGCDDPGATTNDNGDLLLKSRVNDTFRIKVVVQVEYDGETTTTSAEFGTQPYKESPSTQAVLSMAGVGANDEPVIIGGVTSNHGFKFRCFSLQSKGSRLRCCMR